jgi:hypothetical protein
MRRILRVNGAIVDIPAKAGRKALAKLLDAEVLTMKLPLANPAGHVMIVDDSGQGKRTKQVNQQATDLYLAEHPGVTHQIRGDVVIAPASEVEEL